MSPLPPLNNHFSGLEVKEGMQAILASPTWLKFMCLDILTNHLLGFQIQVGQGDFPVPFFQGCTLYGSRFYINE